MPCSCQPKQVTMTTTTTTPFPPLASWAPLVPLHSQAPDNPYIDISSIRHLYPVYDTVNNNLFHSTSNKWWNSDDFPEKIGWSNDPWWLVATQTKNLSNLQPNPFLKRSCCWGRGFAHLHVASVAWASHQKYDYSSWTHPFSWLCLGKLDPKISEEKPWSKHVPYIPNDGSFYFLNATQQNDREKFEGLTLSRRSCL